MTRSYYSFRCFSFPSADYVHDIPNMYIKGSCAGAFCFKRGAKKGPICTECIRTSGSNVGTARPRNRSPIKLTPVNNPNSGVCWGQPVEVGSSKSTKQLDHRPAGVRTPQKTNRWKHPVSGLQPTFFSQMNVKLGRPLSTNLGNLNAERMQQLHPRDSPL